MNILLKNISEILTLESAFKKDGRHLLPNDISLIANGAIIFNKKKIEWIGSSKNIPLNYKIDKEFDLTGFVVTPEIVDSHTHLVFAGDRSVEYVSRINGKSYQDIYKEGGGINTTVKSTSQETELHLFDMAVNRINHIHSLGIGTIEIKSGYGLSLQSERKITEVIHRLKKHFKGKVQIFNTYLAAHGIPASSNSKEYLDNVVWPLLEEFSQSKMIDAVDIFFEKDYFNKEETEELLIRSKKYNLLGKIHADEFNDNKGAILASKHQALSCDHLLETTEDGILALSQSKTVATVLPGTSLFLGKKFARAREMLNSGVKVAMASDYNPGSCHCDNLLMLASIAAPQYKMNITELWAAITLNASHSLGLKTQGALLPGMTPRFSMFKTEHFEDITYSWGKNLATNIFIDQFN